MGLYFDWDEQKARTNEQKHGVTFDEAATVLADPLSVTILDPLHSHDELRWVTMGTSSNNRLLVVVHTDLVDRIRIISARKASRRERKTYEEEQP